MIVILVAQQKAMDDGRHLRSIEPLTVEEQAEAGLENIPLQERQDEGFE